MISFNIYSGETLPRTQWHVLAEQSLMAAPDFISVWQNRHTRPVFFALTENDRVRAGMAGVISGGKFMPRFESMIDGLGGGVITADHDEAIAARLYGDVWEYFKRHRFFRASIHNPKSEINHPGYKKSTHFSHVIDISNSGVTRDPKVDEHIRTGRKRGARVVPFDNPSWLEAFYSLVLQTARRHGTRPRYAPVVFARLHELSKKDKRIIWLAVLHKDQLIASRISFIENARIINWQSFSDKESAHLKANYLMMDYIINLARDSGIDKIDLGGSPGNADGLLDFKKRWGGCETTVSSYTYCTPLGKLYYRWKNR